MSTYRELSNIGMQNLLFVQTGDRFTKDGYTYEVGERIEDDTYHLTNLSTRNKGKCFLNQIIDRTKRGNYDGFRRVVVKDISANDIIYDIYRDKHYTVISFMLALSEETMLILKDDSNKKVRWMKSIVLEEINKDKLRLIKNTTNNNEKISVTNTDIDREGEARAITSSTTRLITISSRLVGNAKAGAIKTTRTCSFKISKNSISI